jgi:hypothetical protein
MKTYINEIGQNCVIITKQDGSSWSGLESAYDEMIAQQEHLTENPTEDVE